MRTGRSSGGGAAKIARGFTYIWLLFVLALAGVALGTLAEQWQLVAQREREAELIWRGRQIAQALASWRAATPAGQADGAPAPTALEELLVDERHSPPRHHLRQLYADPFTGHADWVLWRDAEGRIAGLSSRSDRPALRRSQAALVETADPKRPRVGDWLFEPVEPPAATTTAPAPGAQKSGQRRNL